MDEESKSRRRLVRVGLAVAVTLALLAGLAGSGHAAPGGVSAARRQQAEATASRAVSWAEPAAVGDGQTHSTVVGGSVTRDGVWWWIVRTVRIVGPWGVPDVTVVTLTLIWWGGPSCPRTYTVATDGTHTATSEPGPGCTASDARAHVIVEAVTNRTATGGGMDAGELADLIPTVGVPAVACPGAAALCQQGSPVSVTSGRVPVGRGASAHWPTGSSDTKPAAGASLTNNLSHKSNEVEV